jgi:hypothetical protein
MKRCGDEGDHTPVHVHTWLFIGIFDLFGAVHLFLKCGGHLLLFSMRRNVDPSQLVCKIATPEPDIPIRRRQRRGQVERVQKAY